MHYHRAMTQLFLLLLSAISISRITAATPPCQPINLRCEYLTNPLGIDAQHPRLTWQLDDRRAGAIQTGYAITVSTDSIGSAICWTTGRRSSPDQLTTYDGPALKPFTRYYWQVEVWD